MKNLKQQHLIIIIGVMAAILLVIGGSVLGYGMSKGGTLPWAGPTATPTSKFSFADLPEIKVTPPPSLKEIANDIRKDYPELADLLENPELGSVYKDFYLAYKNGGKEAAIALARQRGILNSQDEIEMTLVLDSEETAPLIKEIEAEKVIVHGAYKNLISIAIPLSLIEEQVKAESPSLIVERIANMKHVIRLEFPKKAVPQQGIILGQGVDLTMASRWHAQGITGKGVKVGILDLGFGGYKKLLGKELPDQVTVKTFGDDDEFNKEVHGTACTEIVHEMAPDAELYLAYYDGSDVSMGQAVEWLISQGVNIITNSTNSIGTTPLDGSGFSDKLVDLAYNSGIFWVNSAGNYAQRHYRGQFKDDNGDNFHDFNSARKHYLSFFAGEGFPTRIVLGWDDWDSVDQDYELLLYDNKGKLLAKSEESQNGNEGETPLEGFVYEFDKEGVYRLAIENLDGKARGDATFDLFIEPSEIDPDLVVAEHSLGSPADASNAFAVGATHWDEDALEPYSSQGPTTDGRLKPDISAPSAVDSASYYPDNFPGTSSSSPHVAGAAALILQAFPDDTPDDLARFIKERALDLGPIGPDNMFGAGRLNLGSAPDDPTISTTPAPTPLVEVRPTSTPDHDFGKPGAPGAPSDSDVEAFLGLVILTGLCLMCLGGLVILGLIIVGLLFMFL